MGTTWYVDGGGRTVLPSFLFLIPYLPYSPISLRSRQGVIASALPPLAKELQLSNMQQEWVVSILYVGGGLGALVGGALADAWGRLNTILLVDVCFVAGAVILFVAPSLPVVLVGRVVVGFSVAVSGLADVSYLNEIAPIEYRGAIVSVNEACISLGFLLAFVVGALLGENWRLMFGASGIIALVQFLGMYRMPESPAWLEQQGLSEDAERARHRIASDEHQSCNLCHTMPPKRHAAPSYQAIEVSSKRRPSLRLEPPLSISSETPPALNPRSSYPITWRRVLTAPLLLPSLLHAQVAFVSSAMTDYRRQTWVALFLAIAQQLCGQTNVMSYALVIFSYSGDDQDPWATFWVGLVKFAVTCIVIWKIETTGRRFFLLGGLTVITVGLALLVLAFLDLDKPEEVQSSARLGLAMPGVLCVVCGYSMSFGPLTWLITSELYPPEIRGRALGFSSIVTCLFAILVTSTFLSLQTMVGASTVFGFYLIATVLGVAFATLAISETREKSPHDIDLDLRWMPWWRTRRRDRPAEDASSLFGESVDVVGTPCQSPESELPQLT